MATQLHYDEPDLVVRLTRLPSKLRVSFAALCAASVAYAIRARLGDDPQNAAWAARRAYSAVDHFIMSQIHSTRITREHQQFILSHPLVQAELRRQQADLEALELVSAEKSLPASVISDLRDRARRDSA